MARGRRGDPPALQQAKGNPGRRQSKVEKAIAEAQRVAQLLAATPMDADGLAPPEFLTDARLAPALATWRELGPELRRTQRLQDHHKPLFAMLCVYRAEWLRATLDIVENGEIQKVQTVAGGKMERIRPIVHFREIARGNLLDLARHFGLTPREEYALFRDQADAFARNPGLFGGRLNTNAPPTDPVGEGAVETPAAPSNASLVGILDGLDSAPPGHLPN